MRRETATHTEDLPHAFDQTGFGRLCAVCQGGRQDLLHRVQSATEQAAEHESQTLPRELGS